MTHKNDDPEDTFGPDKLPGATAADNEEDLTPDHLKGRKPNKTFEAKGTFLNSEVLMKVEDYARPIHTRGDFRIVAFANVFLVAFLAFSGAWSLLWLTLCTAIWQFEAVYLKFRSERYDAIIRGTLQTYANLAAAYSALLDRAKELSAAHREVSDNYEKLYNMTVGGTPEDITPPESKH